VDAVDAVVGCGEQKIKRGYWLAKPKFECGAICLGLVMKSFMGAVV
jgi:hypothetical protein